MTSCGNGVPRGVGCHFSPSGSNPKNKNKSPMLIPILFHEVRPFFFDYLVYGSADPILQDFEKKKKKKFFFFFFFFFFTNFQLLVPSPDKGGGQINYGVRVPKSMSPHT